MKLNEIVEKLKGKSEVEAVFVTGSLGVGKQKTFSDIDLCVILQKDIGLKGAFQWVDDKTFDIYFLLRKILKNFF